MSTALLLEPASPMPVPPQIGGVPRDDDEVPDARFDPGLAPGAHIGLARLIRLHGIDGLVPATRVVIVRDRFHLLKSIPYSVFHSRLTVLVLLLATCYLLLCPHEFRICR